MFLLCVEGPKGNFHSNIAFSYVTKPAPSILARVPEIWVTCRVAKQFKIYYLRKLGKVRNFVHIGRKIAQCQVSLTEWFCWIFLLCSLFQHCSFQVMQYHNTPPQIKQQTCKVCLYICSYIYIYKVEGYVKQPKYLWRLKIVFFV